MLMLKLLCWDELLLGSSAGPRGDQEEVAAVAPAAVHELRHQISAPVYRQQQQQLQHPDLHAGAVQPQNPPGFVLLPRRPLQHMSPHRRRPRARNVVLQNIRTANKTREAKSKNTLPSSTYAPLAGDTTRLSGGTFEAPLHFNDSAHARR